MPKRTSSTFKSVYSTNLHRTCPVCGKTFDSSYSQEHRFRTQFKMHMKYAHNVTDQEAINQMIIEQSNSTPHLAPVTGIAEFMAEIE